MVTRTFMDRRIKWGFLTSLAILIALGILSYASLSMLLSSTGWVDHTQEVLTTSEQALSSITSAESEQRGFLLTHDSIFRRDYDNLLAGSRSSIVKLCSLTRDDSGQTARCEELRSLTERRILFLEQVLSLMRTDGMEKSNELIQSKGRGTMQAIDSLVSAIQSYEGDLLLERMHRRADTAAATRWALVLGTVVAALSLVGAMTLLERDRRRRNRIENELRASELRYQIVAKATNDAVWDWSMATGQIHWNDGLHMLFGHDPLIGNNRGWWSEQVHPEDRESVLASLESILKKPGRNWSHEFRFRRADGTYAYVFDRGYILRRFDGAPHRMIGAMMDFTHNRESELALSKAKDEAEAANRTKSEFLANMSHELRTPLNSVIGFAHVLMKNKSGNLLERDLSFLEKIHGNGKHLLHLINTLLDLSKIEAGKMEVHLEQCDLAALLERTASEFASQASERGLEMRVEAAPCTLETDAGKMTQVLINLVGNALKFTEKGSITLRLVYDQASRARIEVEDTGPGIPRERHAAVFEAFRQADNSTSRRFGGTGLGLTISKSILQLLGFRLDLESEVGKGSRFLIRLDEAAPVREAHGQRAISAPQGDSWVPALPAAGGVPREGHRNILIIDDDADSRLLLSHHLTESGYNVAMASHGKQGLEMARRMRPDAITLDLLMPEMDGWKVLKALKTDKELSDIPVIIVSIVAEESRSKTLGPVDFLDKPFEKDLLAKTLRRHIKGADQGVLVVEDDAKAWGQISRILAKAGIADVRLAESCHQGLQLASERTPSLILLDMVVLKAAGMEFLERFRSRPENWNVPVVVITARDLTSEESLQLQTQCVEILTKGADMEERLRATLEGIWSKRVQA